MALKGESQFLPSFEGTYSLLSILYSPCTNVWIIMLLFGCSFNLMTVCTLYDVCYYLPITVNAIAGAVFA